jgi:hypothetical protein
MCLICSEKSYVVVERDDGRKAIERCDNCAGSLSDQRAAILARHDGIACDETPPYYLKDSQ